MSTFSLDSVPGSIVCFGAPRQKVRSVAEGGNVKTKEVTIDLDVSDPCFAKMLDVVFPGFDFALKATAGRNDGTMKSAAFDWTVTKKLPPITLTCIDPLGGEVLRVANVKIKNKPKLSVGLGADKVSMTIVVVCQLTPSQVTDVNENQDVDLSVTLTTSQMDIAETDVEIETDGDGFIVKAKKKKTGRTSIAIDTSIAH